jgi:hypothetical protein
MESAAVDWFPKDQEQINEMVNIAWKEIERLWLAYEMQVNDFEFFSKECPKHMARIDEITHAVEPPMPIDDIRVYVDKWVKNYEYVFKKRSINKRIKHGRKTA